MYYIAATRERRNWERKEKGKIGRKGEATIGRYEFEECLFQCEKLLRDLEKASEIPKSRFSGKTAEAVKETREWQKEKLRSLINDISGMIERR